MYVRSIVASGLIGSIHARATCQTLQTHVCDRLIIAAQVSRWQVAELIAAAVADPAIAENKVLEVVAEETAPLRWGNEPWIVSTA